MVEIEVVVQVGEQPERTAAVGMVVPAEAAEPAGTEVAELDFEEDNQ